MSSIYYPGNNINNAKMNDKWNFWGRPTIAWSLACEAAGQTRMDAYNLVSKGQSVDDSVVNTYILTVFWIDVIAVCVLGTVVSCGACFIGRANHGKNVKI